VGRFKVSFLINSAVCLNNTHDVLPNFQNAASIADALVLASQSYDDIGAYVAPAIHRLPLALRCTSTPYCSAISFTTIFVICHHHSLTITVNQHYSLPLHIPSSTHGNPSLRLNPSHSVRTHSHYQRKAACPDPAVLHLECDISEQADPGLSEAPRSSGLAQYHHRPAGCHGHSLIVFVDVRQLQGPKPVFAAHAGLLRDLVPVPARELCSTGLCYMEVAGHDGFRHRSRSAHVEQEAELVVLETSEVAYVIPCGLALDHPLEEVFHRWVVPRRA
jgi:hypothetical protein